MLFNLTRDTITPDLMRKLAQVQRPRTIIEAGAKGGQREIVTHLRTLQARGNEKRWPSQGFFARGRNSVGTALGVRTCGIRGA